MGLIEIKRVVMEAMDECAQQKPPKMQFSKKLILGASIFFALFGIASFVLWVVTGSWPQEIAEFFIWPIIGLVSYMLKSGYENKAKIDKGKKGM